MTLTRISFNYGIELISQMIGTLEFNFEGNSIFETSEIKIPLKITTLTITTYMVIPKIHCVLLIKRLDKRHQNVYATSSNHTYSTTLLENFL